MALIISKVNRKFIFEKEHGKAISLSDVNSEFTPQQVLNHYSVLHPELTTAIIEGPTVREEEVEYRFITKLGTKG